MTHASSPEADKKTSLDAPAAVESILFPNDLSFEDILAQSLKEETSSPTDPAISDEDLSSLLKEVSSDPVEKAYEPEVKLKPDDSNTTTKDKVTPKLESKKRSPLTNNRASPPMWVLKDEDSEIWLLGTFHILPPGLDWRSDALARAIDLADTVVFEAELDTPAAKNETISTLLTKGFLPKGETLSNLLSQSEHEKLQGISTEVRLPFAAIDTMRPWQAFLSLTIQFIVSQGFEPGSGVDAILLKEARLRDRDLDYFETVAQQLALFTSLESKTELKLLKTTIADWEVQKEEFDKLFNAWRTGDVQKLDDFINDSMRDHAPEVYTSLVINRNEAWAEKIATQMEGSGRTLIAVGAAHLVGENSVPDLLEKAGHDVARYGVDK